MGTSHAGSGGSNVPADARPDFLVPAVRCALEMTLAGGLVLLIGLPADNVVYFGVVVTLAIVVMVAILFWALNRQIEQWLEATTGTQQEREREQQRKQLTRTSSE